MSIFNDDEDDWEGDDLIDDGLDEDDDFDSFGSIAGEDDDADWKGVSIRQSAEHKEVIIQPITSRGKIGRCHISIPEEALTEFVTKLMKVANEN